MNNIIKGASIILGSAIVGKSSYSLINCDENKTEHTSNLTTPPTTNKPKKCCSSKKKCIKKSNKIISNNHHNDNKEVNEKLTNSTKMRKDLAKEILSWKEANFVPGISVCIQNEGETIYKEAFGYSDIENAIPMNTSSKLRIASISKALTAIGLGVLMDEGKIKLEDSIQKYVPEFPKSPNYPDEELSVGDVASHLGGIRHYGKNRATEFYSVGKYKTSKEYNPHNHPNPLQMFINNPWVEDLNKTKPGHYYSYSTFGYTLLGLVIEEASGKDFLSFMREKVFKPCGMYSTLPDEHDTLIPGRSKQYALKFIPRSTQEIAVSGYNEPKVVLCNAEFTNSSYKWPGGGFISTAEDLCRLGSTLLIGNLLKTDTIKRLFTPNPPKTGKSPQEYATGWIYQKNNEVKNNDSGKGDIIYHTGNAVGGSTVLVTMPNERIVVTVLANQEKTSGSIAEFGFKLGRITSQYKDNYTE
ncbi:hypothetical protein DICPUDRAFT_151403 [Dictyostelium purpureum]|uniref:Beta-lactamase-related domain-containing protein n=1 Tax=Dictyostelium purpureum TaxID=5786 RepID=F0ZIR2_DICPU|nr:uncharacterized protein DICPUDRAFT_151403 [Dictyostelium purpureum]EGC36169.1 hypothetical protein DICPUDRAFT_151403 [Dictyostelium purpureum]|eukprot:XP_003287302.1 hypothetical protein DICPUDRAFT_151403 [Dictyostelium purpureum]